MKVLLLGGTGAMGKHLGDILVEQGHNVVITSRRKYENYGNIAYLQGDAHNMEFLVSALKEKWDVIIDFMIYSTAEFKARISVLLSCTAQYIYLSSARVYADSDELLTEDSPRLLDVSSDKKYLATDEYALCKARQEDVLLMSGHKNWTVIRPYITFSETRLQLGVMEKDHWLERCLRTSPIVFSKDIARRTTTLTYGYDVARGIAAVCGMPNALGEIFHITGNKYFTWETVLQRYVKVLEKNLGRPVAVVMIDKAFQANTPFKYQVIYDRYYNRKFDNSKISQFISVESFKDPLNELERCLEKFLENPFFKDISVSYHAKQDRCCGVTMSISTIKGWDRKIKYLLCRYFLPL